MCQRGQAGISCIALSHGYDFTRRGPYDESMSISLLVPFLLGVVAVFQGLLNEKMGKQFGLPVTAFINNAVGFGFAAAFLALCWVSFSQKSSFHLESFRWWQLLPGFLGLLFVLGLPYSIQTVGPAKTFVILVGSQVLFGVLAEVAKDPSFLTREKMIGISLVIAGTLLIHFR